MGTGQEGRGAGVAGRAPAGILCPCLWGARGGGWRRGRVAAAAGYRVLTAPLRTEGRKGRQGAMPGGSPGTGPQAHKKAQERARRSLAHQRGGQSCSVMEDKPSLGDTPPACPQERRS